MPTEQPAADAPATAQTAGVLGDGALHPGKGNLRLLARAIRERWPISEDVRARVVNQMSKVVDGSPEERNVIAAARVLVQADACNLREQALDQPQTVLHHHSGAVGVGIVELRQEVLHDPNYLEFLRHRAAAENGDAGVVRANDQQRPLEDAAAPGVSGSGAH